ncbi:integrase family protein [Salinarchaeum sp. Harcht-Bsk1]|uniref:site-specific integrase n=1 Tax=Salinarchaeum sp. Harcht-Bsk1 TaxID=1333523 RepID=UPI0003422DE2|nr:site-specific integrase [Salinarchaeum sp. Harcht-Bsk1]AGN01154.1 integrase family protein [Salinarchaeum sp. Harcht-Bsk1]
MARTDDPDHRYLQARNRLRDASIPDRDKEASLEFLDALNPDTSTINFYSDDGVRETKSYGTLAAYAQALKRVAELAEQPLCEFENARAVNALFDDLGSGEHPDVKEGGYGKSTMAQWESAVSKFFEHHDSLGVDHEAIVIDRQEKSTVDERDMYTPDQVQQLREAVTNTRDRCILELLLNTGQRIRAVQTLRVKDVNTDAGVYYLNTADGGLKGADKNGKKRPLLGAKRAVYDWLKDHPTGEPDDYLITCLPTAARGTPGDKLSQSNIRDRLRGIADDAGVDKPPNPHNFRHYFVTACKRDYEMDESTIKHLIGHGQGSRIMETTYQHLSDNDHVEAAEVAAGLREPDAGSPLTPKICPTCSESLAPEAKACPGCGTVFAPDAQATQAQIEEDVKADYRETDPSDEETMERLETLDELLDDPEVKEALFERVD